MWQLSQCRVHYKNNTHKALLQKTAKILHIRPEDIRHFTICRRSIDARKKPEIFYSYTVAFEVNNEQELLKKNRRNKNLTVYHKEPELPVFSCRSLFDKPVVVVGAGPAGLFAAYYLTLCGASVVVVERGKTVNERTADVEKFWKDGQLLKDSNVSFGEGGAGTFSDGKLNTGVKDKSGRKNFVLESFVRFGADRDILYDANPHIGTDVLRQVITNMRKEMERLGCHFSFNTKMDGLITNHENKIQGIRIVRGQIHEEIDCSRVILAAGHSARDTFEMLREQNVSLSKKSFAVGVRVQHRQSDIDGIQYGGAKEGLPPSPYKCTGKTRDGRGVYSFCMCPGGYVVNASTEEGMLTVNGMSYAARDSGAANSAVVVTVDAEDFGGTDVLAGVEFQRKWEKQMFLLLSGRVPVQCYGDFKKGRKTEKCGAVRPCVKGEWGFANLRKALPKFIIDGMIDGIECFDKKMPGFAGEDTLLMGLEARTSSPVRIERGENFVSLSHPGLYPCGEGAGYAGGIMSAAMDGLRVSEAVVRGANASANNSHGTKEEEKNSER